MAFDPITDATRSDLEEWVRAADARCKKLESALTEVKAREQVLVAQAIEATGRLESVERERDDARNARDISLDLCEQAERERDTARRELKHAEKACVQAAQRVGWMPLVHDMNAANALKFFERQLQMREDFGQGQFRRAKQAERERDAARVRIAELERGQGGVP